MLNPDGTFTYTPAPNFFGTDTFTYQANNGVFARGDSSVAMSPDSNTATVTITVTPVNEPRVARVKPEKTDVWFTTSKSSKTKFDIKAEVLKNGQVVATGTRTNTTLGFGTSFHRASYEEIAMWAGPIAYGEEDTLSVRVSIKLSHVEGAPSSAATKLYFNVPTPPGNSSHLHAKRDSKEVKYYMIRVGGTGASEERDRAWSHPGHRLHGDQQDGVCRDCDVDRHRTHGCRTVQRVCQTAGARSVGVGLIRTQRSSASSSRAS